MSNEESDWNGMERREAKRRYTTDRRDLERKKKFWVNLLLPIVIGVGVTSIITWGAYVTHVTYGISAKYEQTFVAHLENQASEDIKDDIRMDAMVLDYNSKIVKLSETMKEGFDELREDNRIIYNLLVTHERNRIEEKQN
jgi:hypothetical protein